MFQASAYGEINTHYFNAMGDRLNVVRPSPAMNGAWGEHIYKASLDIEDEKITKEEPSGSGNYCHTIEVAEGTSTVEAELRDIAIYLHTWTAPCQEEQNEWDRFAAFVRGHELGHKEVNESWNDESLAVKSPAIGKSSLVQQVFTISVKGIGSTEKEAEDDADDKYDKEYEKRLKLMKEEGSRIHSQYHEGTEEKGDPDRTIICP